MTDAPNLKALFRRLLMKWDSRHNHREMPWKGQKDPYRVWLSEIILQQTRVEQGLHYYNRFVKAFPTVQALGNAPEKKVLKLWEGLGYYSRCRNLVFTAKFISRDLGGIFPATYEDIRRLKGVGPYTAAAISAFAYNMPYAVVDGNVYRVLSRIFGIDAPTTHAEGKRIFARLAQELLHKKQPAKYNQAIMDFGATICKPSPDCGLCPMTRICHAFRADRVGDLPVKTKKAGQRKRWFNYFIIEHGGRVAIRQRIKKDIWEKLYEFPMIESDQNLDPASVTAMAKKQGLLGKNGFRITQVSEAFRQQLSHQLIEGRFIRVEFRSDPPLQAGWKWIPGNRLSQFPFPRIINAYRAANQSSTPFR